MATKLKKGRGKEIIVHFTQGLSKKLREELKNFKTQLKSVKYF